MNHGQERSYCQQCIYFQLEQTRQAGYSICVSKDKKPFFLEKVLHTSYITSTFCTLCCVKRSLELKVFKWKIKTFILSQVSSVRIFSPFSYKAGLELTWFVWNSSRGPARSPTDLACQSSFQVSSLINITVEDISVLRSPSPNAVGDASY